MVESECLMATGTFECPICGFDKIHTHEQGIVEWYRTGRAPKGYLGPGPMNASQKAAERRVAEEQYRMAELRKELEANPRAYVGKYGTINSVEGVMVVPWLLDLVDQLRAALPRRQSKQTCGADFGNACEGHGCPVHGSADDDLRMPQDGCGGSGDPL